MLEKDIKEIGKIPAKPMIFGENDRKQFQKATKCWICQGEFSKDDKKVRDHCHFTGKYRGAAHNSCNLQYKKPKFTPVVFHNLSGYDNHLFVKNLGKTEGNINCIPNNEEKYISFTKEVVVGSYTGKDGKEKDVKHQLRFIDSFKFMASSLDKLSGNLDQDCFTNTSKYYNGKHLDLLMRKGVYPYEYMDSLKRLNETALPRKVAFYSRLSGEEISDDDYEHAQTVWKEFGMKSLRDYHELYNQSDVLLLADVFENFRDVCIKNYDLDPAWYYTAPGLAWDAALKITELKLELLSDPDMLLMVEKGIRGGISMISNRYGKANNPYMGETFNTHDPAKYIAYLDANNLYGWAMSKPLPTHGFEWMTDSEMDSWKNHSCILEVDLEYPKDLHDLHNDYPLAPESLKVHNVEKLIPNLNDKTNYVIHYENLKLYEGLGMKITKIHRGIRLEEKKGGLVKGKYEYSFGDGATGKNAGYTVLAPSKVLKIGMSVTTPESTPEEAGVVLVVNGSKTQCGGLFRSFHLPPIGDLVMVDVETGDGLYENAPLISQFAAASKGTKVKTKTAYMIVNDQKRNRDGMTAKGKPTFASDDEKAEYIITNISNSNFD
ncbi:uncharacterized protein LOC132552555 [Ylistrum balloti]|uniref:uncharacterized protein LOC132552555 n=1 Tax=Ylistrum balloti TaxID=509963 RepID=UPI002905F315|nr:uncharacterized protein LOC132552555 [Ylistrum balloti]